jgi:hypothetical protein
MLEPAPDVGDIPRCVAFNVSGQGGEGRRAALALAPALALNPLPWWEPPCLRAAAPKLPEGPCLDARRHATCPLPSFQFVPLSTLEETPANSYVDVIGALRPLCCACCSCCATAAE